MSTRDIVLRKARITSMINAICEMGHTPEVVVNMLNPRTLVNRDHGNPDGSIILGIAGRQIGNYSLTDKGMEFNYSRGGVDSYILAPLDSIMFIWAREDKTIHEKYDFIDVMSEDVFIPRCVEASDIDVQGNAPIGDPEFILRAV